MNLNPELSPDLAILMSLLAASMWGSWFVSLKHLGDYPLDGFFMTLFVTSIVFVWGVGFTLDGRALLDNIGHVWVTDPPRVWATLAGGGVYAIGMRYSLMVLRTLGLSLAQPLQSSVGILSGTLVTTLVGGVPQSVSFGQILLAAIVLIGAVCVSMLAGHIRSQAQASLPPGRGRITTRDLWQSLGLVLVSSLLTPAYPFALSYGLRSSTHVQGLAVLPFMALLASGAFIGSLLSSGVNLTRQGQWPCVLSAPLRLHKFGIGSGLFHYGGNIIHTFATGYLSSALSWPLGITGITAGLWTQVGGWFTASSKDRRSKRTWPCSPVLACIYWAPI